MTEEPMKRGRRAQVISHRAGLAPPEAPFVIEHREALIYMLCQAAELEHGGGCASTCTRPSAWSSRGQHDRRGTRAVRKWRKQISHVATQEMLHLSLVQNLLSAIGGAPHMSRPNFPHPARHYPAGVHLALLPFGDQALRHFMYLERPEGMDLEDADGMAAFGRACPPWKQARSSRAGRSFRPSRTPLPVHRGRDRAPGGQVRGAVDCSSARRGRRPPTRTSAGPSWSRSPTWRRRSAAIDEILPSRRGTARPLGRRALRPARGDPGRVCPAPRGQPGLQSGPP